MLECLRKDPHPRPWLTALIKQLERNLGVHSEEALYTPLCSRRLEELTQHVAGFSETGGWAKCFSSQTVEYDSQSAPSLSQRKRKGSCVTIDSDEETVQQSKRKKMDICDSEHAEEQRANEEVSRRLDGDAQSKEPAKELQPAKAVSCDALPEHIKVK